MEGARENGSQRPHTALHTAGNNAHTHSSGTPSAAGDSVTSLTLLAA